MSVRVPTGHPLLDAMLGGGFPEGLTVIACDDRFAVDAIAALCRPLAGGGWSGAVMRVVLLFYDPQPAGMVRRRALLHNDVYVLVRESPAEEGPDDMRTADVFLRATASTSRLIIEAVKNQGRPLAAVRFTTAGALAEIDVVPSGEGAAT